MKETVETATDTLGPNAKHLSLKYTLFIALILFLLFFAFRLYINLGTLGNDYVYNYYRFGVIPWSDARGWADGAFEVINGEQLTGVPARRPLYPLFLTTLFSVFSFSYRNVIFFQMAFFAFMLALAYFLVRDVKPRLAVILFLSFLAIWRPGVSTLFMTENLGIYVLILSFVMIWRGLETGARSTTLSGLFLLGLSQAVRPWCVASLATVPFLAFFSNHSINTRLKIFIMYVLFVSLGFCLHPIAGNVFNGPGEGSNFAKTLYGQLLGGKGWSSAHQDPLIKEAHQNNLSPNEINKIIYKRAKDIFIENPQYFINACYEAYKYYFRTIHHSFGADFRVLIYILAFFVVLMLFDGFKKVQVNFLRLIKQPLLLIVPALSVALFYFQYSYFWTCLSLVGMVYVILHQRYDFNKFLLFFFIGIILSIPFVGEDGAERVRIGSDILLYLLASLGVSWSVSRFTIKEINSQSRDLKVKKGRLQLACIPSAAIVIFLCIPYVIKMNCDATHDEDKLQRINAVEIGERLGLNEAPIGLKEIQILKHKWPKPSFEKVNNRLGYLMIRYVERDVVFLQAKEGIRTRMNELWPLSPTNINRSITVLVGRFILFPHITPQKLMSFENKHIIVVGRLITRPRNWLHDTGFVLIASHIAFFNESGELDWFTI